MKNRQHICSVFLALAIVGKAYGLPETCLQAPQRQSACPHLIYKRAALPVVTLNVEKNGIICICLTDVKGLQGSNLSRLEKIDQQVTLQRIAVKYQLDEKDISTLVNN